jgi:uncharacterized membrane protein
MLHMPAAIGQFMAHDLYLLAHVIGATVLLGCAIGIGYAVLSSTRHKTVAEIASVADGIALASLIFTATAILVQPTSGYLLAQSAGWPLTAGWVLMSIGLYGIGGAIWFFGLRQQSRARQIAITSRDTGTDLPGAYHRLQQTFAICASATFAAVLAILWLMITKPIL